MSLDFTVSFLSATVTVQAIYLLIMARTLTRLDFQFKAMRDDMFEILRFMRTGEMRFEKYAATAAYRELFEKRVEKAITDFNLNKGSVSVQKFDRKPNGF